MGYFFCKGSINSSSFKLIGEKKLFIYGISRESELSWDKNINHYLCTHESISSHT